MLPPSAHSKGNPRITGLLLADATAFSMNFTGTILTEGDEPTTEIGVLWEKWDGNWDSLRPEDCEGMVAFTKQADGLHHPDGNVDWDELEDLFDSDERKVYAIQETE